MAQRPGLKLIEADERWDRDTAWRMARVYRDALLKRPELRGYGIYARQMNLARRYGPRRVWAVWAGPLSSRPE